MLNSYYQAMRLWETNQKKDGFSTINDYLVEQLNQSVFMPSPSLFKSPYCQKIEYFIDALMENNSYLVAPFARVYPYLWSLHPTSYMLRRLKQRQLLSMPDIPDYILEYEEGIDPVTTIEDLSATAEALITSARKGIISPTPNRRSQSGRVALPLAEIEQIPDEQWGPLKEMLLEGLPTAFKACPPDFWQILALEEPEEVVCRFLYEVFGEFGLPWETSLMRLEMIFRHHSSYAAGIQLAISQLMEKNNNSLMTEMVQIVGGLTNVKNSPKFLLLVKESLDKKATDRLIDLVV